MLCGIGLPERKFRLVVVDVQVDGCEEELA